MDNTRRTETKEIAALASGKWAKGAAAMLLSASLILSACGGGADEPVAEPTAVATMAAPAADTPTVAASDATTDTEEVDDSDATTDTAEVDDSDAVTDTEEVDDSDAMTDTEDADDSDTMTDTEGMDDSDAMTDTEEVDDSDSVTGTEDVDDSDTTTDTAAAGASDDADDADSADDVALMGVSGVSPKQYVRASTLLDYDFENMNNEVSGDLEDLLIDLSTGRVLFASIEYGGVLDLGDKDIVVPMNAFAIGEEGELVLNIDETALENYPDVGNDWPNLNDPAWDDDVNTYWNDTGVNVGEGFAEATTTVGWASDIIGRNIADLGFGAGSILDILVNLGTGQAPYLVVDHGEGLDTDPLIIPLAAYDVSDWNNEFAYGPDFTPDMIETAPRWDREMYPEGTAYDEEFGDNIESFWNDLGFTNDLNNDGEVD